MTHRVEQLAEGKVTLLGGDCLTLLATLDANSIDACVTDPPYHLTSLPSRTEVPGKWGQRTEAEKAARSVGFMGKSWDGGDIAFRPDVWREVFRVLKPGGHLLSFGGTRTYHRMACAIEDAGFEIRDCCSWNFGSGFPKSLSVSKQIDKAAGAEREVVGRSENSRPAQMRGARAFDAALGSEPLGGIDITEPATDAARQWQGWGTALKPAMELICVARKPLSESTVAANVLKWGTGALNIGGCRVEAGDLGEGRTRHGGGIVGNGTSFELPDSKTTLPSARWPANVIHDGSDEVVGAFPETNSGALSPGHGSGNSFGVGNDDKKPRAISASYGANSGSAARFFYTAKADSDDRLGSKHPTVKPLDLVQYLCRLVCPPKGLVLDCFAGTGTTGEAAFREGMRAVLIEREEEYQADIIRRMSLCMSSRSERAREGAKARFKDKPVDMGPLFGGTAEAVGGGG